MYPVPTPIADELEVLAALVADSVRYRRPLASDELQHIADRLRHLVEQTAGLERFHRAVVAEAEEDELRRSTNRSDPHHVSAVSC